MSALSLSYLSDCSQPKIDVANRAPAFALTPDPLHQKTHFVPPHRSRQEIERKKRGKEGGDVDNKTIRSASAPGDEGGCGLGGTGRGREIGKSLLGGGGSLAIRDDVRDVLPSCGWNQWGRG